METMELVKEIQRAFSEFDDRTADEWAAEWLVDGTIAAREMAIWKIAADAYTSFSTREKTPNARRNIFHVVTGSLNGPADKPLQQHELKEIGKAKAQEIRGTLRGVLGFAGLVCSHGYVTMNPGVHTDIEYTGNGPIKMAKGTHSRCKDGAPEILHVTMAPVHLP